MFQAQLCDAGPPPPKKTKKPKAKASKAKASKAMAKAKAKSKPKAKPAAAAVGKKRSVKPRESGQRKQKQVEKEKKVKLVPEDSPEVLLLGLANSQMPKTWVIASDCSGMCTEGLAASMALPSGVKVVHAYASESCPKKRTPTIKTQLFFLGIVGFQKFVNRWLVLEESVLSGNSSQSWSSQ